jgi:hypothetical protein
MNTPETVPFSALNGGDVFSSDLTQFNLKVDSASFVNLATGELVKNVPPTTQYYALPSATLVI